MAARKQAAKATKKNLSDLPSIIAEYKSQVSNDARVLVKDELNEFFNQYPEIDGIRWCQCVTVANEVDMLPEDLRIEQVEYKVKGHVSQPPVPYSNAPDSGYDKERSGWVSPWNDRRITDPSLLDSLTVLEERLFNYQMPLALAFGGGTRITVTRNNVAVEEIPDTNN